MRAHSVNAAAEEAKWRAEDDMRTLMRAAEIRADRKRLAAAQKCAKDKLTEMAAVISATGVDAPKS